jgi:Lar family restriction alleviation protein
MADLMQQARELLPCPFCGEAVHLLVEHLDGTIIHPAYRVRCDYCGASSGYTDKSCAELWNARAALRVAPEGFVLVPVKPTPEMLAAVGNGADGLKRRIWRGMLAARPQGVKDVR